MFCKKSLQNTTRKGGTFFVFVRTSNTTPADEHIDTAKKRQIPRTKADGPDFVIACVCIFVFVFYYPLIGVRGGEYTPHNSKKYNFTENS